MTHDQHKPAARLEHPRYLAERSLEAVDVFDRQAHHHRIERPAAPWHRLGTCPRVSGPAGAVTCHADLGGRRIEPDHLRTTTGDASSDLPLAAPDVEHPSGA